MKLEFDKDQLLKLMKDFYILTGIRVVLYDDEYHQLLSWPEKDCAFCTKVKSYPKLREKCTESDLHSFQQCDNKKALTIYQCHAGLIEAAVPLISNHIIIGYLMFGQIGSAGSRSGLLEKLQQYLKTYEIDASITVDDIPLKTIQQIRAAGTIMQAFTFYTLSNETVAFRSQNFTNNLRSYLLSHLSESLDVNTIAADLGVSRSRLYLECNKYLGTGIAEYIRELRIDKAKELLRTTDKSITEIASDVGFGDYNYFCRFFKKAVGYPAKKYRRTFQSEQE